MTPLTLSSCAEKETDYIYGEEFDKEYNVNEITLIALKKSLRMTEEVMLKSAATEVIKRKYLKKTI